MNRPKHQLPEIRMQRWTWKRLKVGEEGRTLKACDYCRGSSQSRKRKACDYCRSTVFTDSGLGFSGCPASSEPFAFWASCFPCVLGIFCTKCDFFLGIVDWRREPNAEAFRACLGPLSMKNAPCHKMCDKTEGVCTFHTDAQHRLMTHAVQHSHI